MSESLILKFKGGGTRHFEGIFRGDIGVLAQTSLALNDATEGKPFIVVIHKEGVSRIYLEYVESITVVKETESANNDFAQLAQYGRKE